MFGRIGAQTAKQIVLQRIREVERDQVFDQFASREGELMTGTVNRVEPRAIILDVGKNVEAILATTEQSTLEHYRIGQNVKAFVLEVRRSTKGPQIFVSRTHKGFLKRLFELEVPEIHNGTVEIKAIAREAGSRSKVAVASRQEGLDPVGATVGQRGARVQAVVAELSGEKIDVIPWSDDPAVFVANALSPAQVISVDIDEEHRIASVTVPERMLSLAIGREGQNARLAARLTGWRIDIRSDVSVAEARAAATETAKAAARPGAGAPRSIRRPRRPRRPSRQSPPPSRSGSTRKAVPTCRHAPDREPSRSPLPCAAPRRRQAQAHDQEGRHGLRRGGIVGRVSTTVAPRRVPSRSCVACRTVRPKRELTRLVRTPDGNGDRSTRPVGWPGAARTSAAPRHASTRPSPRVPSAGHSEPSSRPTCARRWPGAPPLTATTSKEALVARSRSGTRGRRGPRKPPRRDGTFSPGRRAGPRPARARGDRTARNDHRQGARESCSASIRRTSSAN